MMEEIAVDLMSIQIGAHNGGGGGPRCKDLFIKIRTKTVVTLLLLLYEIL